MYRRNVRARVRWVDFMKKHVQTSIDYNLTHNEGTYANTVKWNYLRQANCEVYRHNVRTRVRYKGGCI
jgi:hypothetical protein